MGRWSFLVIWACLCVGGEVNAKPTLEGDLPGAISLVSDEGIGPDGCWWLDVSAWSRTYSPSTTGQVRIVVGSQAEVIEGDLQRTVYGLHREWAGTSNRRWMLKLRMRENGRLTVRASLHISGDHPGEAYDYEHRLTLDVRGSVVSATENRVTAAIKKERGRRFQYGGTFPVALEADDFLIPDELDSSPKIQSEPVVKVDGSLLPMPREVRVVASIGKAGRVIWIRPAPLDAELPQEVWNFVQASVEAFRFHPATSRGKPVTENVVLTVRLIPE